MDANLVGGIFDNKPFIKGQSPLNSLFGYWGKAVTWLYSYHDVGKRVYYCFLFYGSRYNIIGQDKSRIPFTNTMSDSEFFWQDTVMQIEKNEKEGTSILDCATGEHGYFATRQKWEVVERLRQIYSISLDGAYNNKYLVRVDYRETITKKRFQESECCKFFYSEKYKYREKLFDRYEESNNRLGGRIPDDVDYIVYVFGSPVYVERVQIKEKIHIIDGKHLLYIPDAELEMYINKKGEPNEEEAIEFIKNMLWEAGLLQESRSINQEYWDKRIENHWNDIGKEAFFTLIRQYTTSLPPL